MVVLFDRHPKFLSQVLQSCYIICYIDVQISIISKGSMQNKFSVKVGILAQGGGGAPCIENRGIEDNFIFYIECYFFFIRVRKYKCEFNISK